MRRTRRLLAGLALVLSTGLAMAACQVDGSAAPDPAGVRAAVSAGSSPSSGAPSSGAASGSAGPQSSAPTTGLTPGTIEDHSTDNVPPDAGTSGSSPSAAAGAVLVLADDGYSVSVLVTTVWARALVGVGATVQIRTIDAIADQVSALQSGRVDLVQQYNGSLLDYFDDKSEAISQSDIDAALATKLPTGLAALNSTPARDGAGLAVSAATAAKYNLHSISDLSDHLGDITLLLPSASTATGLAKGLSDYYGLTFPHKVVTDVGGTKAITAIRAGSAVGLMNASQYQIDDDKFVVLTDPEHLFFVENFIPVAGSKITSQMRSRINAVSAKLTVSAVRGMRRQVASGTGAPSEVADAWLASVGLK